MNDVRIAVIGSGLVGRRHVDAIAAATGATLAAIVEPVPEGREYAAGRGVPWFGDLGSLIDARVCDAAILATPTPLHADQAMSCIEAGVPVLIEKPIADASAAARVIVEASEAAGVPIAVGHHRRHNPIIAFAKDTIEEGTLGSVRAVQATCWLRKPDGYFAEAPWRTKRGAGPISVNLVHDIDLLRYLVGEVAEVRAQAAPSARGHENEDVAAAVLSFANGAVGTISVSDAIAAPWSWEHTAGEYPVYPRTSESCYLIGGTRGSLSVPDLTLWRHEEDAGWWSPITATRSPRASVDPLVAQVEQFASVVRGEVEPLVSGREGLRTLEVIEAIQRSAGTGEVVSLEKPR